ncbi:AMP-dependent synthetase [Caballeronia novacaledonica]|uniref:AMP-dependent synthetase n=1 Tax=Caballeronia novacaledonica TaxID=1544861 RepID=A0A2U3IC94_9BURK|nr:AMP-binding protein [Caballeronia novacaledonica]SPB17733.1 AMP-dependent synthetase [Caballeronia novacaledonica]
MIALHDLLCADRDPLTPVCRDDRAGTANDILTHAAFRSRTAALAWWLREQNARRYALCIDDPFDFACTLFALFACGKEPVIPASSAPGYLADLAHAYDAMLTGDDVRALAATQALRPAAPLSRIDPHAPLTLYTSGSSGSPKPIHKTLAQFDAEVRTLEREWGALVGDATMLASVPHRHIYGLLFRVMWPLAAGRAFDRALCAEPKQIQARIASCGATAMVSSPAQLARWPALAGFDALTPAPRVFFSSGGPLAADAAHACARAFGAAPVEIYGSTETGGIAWRRQNETAAWRALHGVDVRRTDDGALEVRSPHLGHDDWHRTDDAIHFDDDGRFRLQGRLDRVIKLDGKRMSLPDMEARLALHPYVAQACVVPLAGASRERVGAVVALSDAGSAALRDEGRVALAKSLRRHLAAYFDVVLLPRRWRFRIALPFDVRGKLPVASVAAAFGARAEGFEMLSEARDGDSLRYELRVPPTLAHFGGHFPNLPILPGIVQVDWAIRLASEHVAGARDTASVDRLKFMAPVPPGAVLDLELAHDAARRRVRFAYRLNGRDCSSGVVVYREHA